MGLFEYISVLTSIIVGLGIAHLLRGVAAIMQHPGRYKLYWVHLVWVGYMFFGMIFFWWFEFRFATHELWLFQDYLFIVAYAVTLFLTCALLFPTDMDGYEGFEDYFMSRRRWFFGLLIAAVFIDLYDTLLKGTEYFVSLGVEYKLFSALNITAALIGAISARPRVQAVIAVVMIAYQIKWAFTFWGQMG